MQILRLNKADWSGQEMTVRVFQNKSFYLYDERYHYTTDTVKDDDGSVICEELHIYKSDEDPVHPIVVVCKFPHDRAWMAMCGSYWMPSDTVVRYDENPLIAGIQVLNNII